MKKQWALVAGLLAAIAVIAAFSKSASLRRKAEHVRCGNQMIAIGLGTCLWAEDNGDYLPPDLSSMSNELNTLKILICPSDATTQLAQSWSSITSGCRLWGTRWDEYRVSSLSNSQLYLASRWCGLRW